MIRSLMKPEYLWRPSQVLRRLAFKPSDEIKPLRLPWHCTISASSAELIGRSIAAQGLYDLPLTEAIIRLAAEGDTMVDVGANIGYATLVLARSAGPQGQVFCFEPNPALFPTLRANVGNWTSSQIARIHIQTMALSDRDGTGILGLPDGFAGNNGLASLELNTPGVSVELRRLDSLEIPSVGIMKVDVEGHEAAVLSGTEKLLARRSIRDILFEEHHDYPARSHKILLDHGYKIFRVTGSTFRPLLLQPDAPESRTFLTYPPNYLATVDPGRAHARFSGRGWYALSSAERRPWCRG